MKNREFQENLCQRFNEKNHQNIQREPHIQSREFEPFFDNSRLLKNCFENLDDSGLFESFYHKD